MLNLFMVSTLFDSLRDIQVGEFDLPLGRAGVGELLPLVGTVEIPPDPRHLRRDLKAAVLLGYDLERHEFSNVAPLLSDDRFCFHDGIQMRNLQDVEFRQQVAVSQRELRPVQEAPGGLGQVS